MISCREIWPIPNIYTMPCPTPNAQDHEMHQSSTHKQPRLKRNTPSHPPSIPRHLEQNRLKLTSNRILPDQFTPVTRLRRRREISIPKRPHRILRNPLRNIGVINQIINFARQIAKIPFHLDVIRLRTRRNQRSMVRLLPNKLVRDHHRATVEEVLPASGETAAFCVR